MRLLHFVPVLAALVLCLADVSGAFWLHMGETPDIDLQRSREAHVTVQYSIEGGIFNQHMDHCHTMMLAIALKAQRLLWPPSQDRDSYKVGYNRQHWSMVEASEIYDMESIAEYAANQHDMLVEVLPVDEYDRPPARIKSYVELEQPLHVGALNRVDIDLPIRRGRQDLQALAEHINEKLDALVQMFESVDAIPMVRVVLDTPFALLSSAPKSIAEPVLQVVSFAPELEALAGQALAAMYSRTGGEVFNGVHLRVEPDARKMRQWRAGAAAVEAQYGEAMDQAGFNASYPLYVASGAFSAETLGTSDSYQWLNFCKQRGSDVVTKDALLPLEVLQDLGNEANGVLDFLVLMRTTKLVGFLGSTFSQQLRLYRSLAGMNPNTTVLVGDIEQNGEEHTPEVQGLSGWLWLSEDEQMSTRMPAVVSCISIVALAIVLVVRVSAIRVRMRSALSPLRRELWKTMSSFRTE